MLEPIGERASRSLINCLDTPLLANGPFDRAAVLQTTFTEQLIPEKPEGSRAAYDRENGQNPIIKRLLL